MNARAPRNQATGLFYESRDRSGASKVAAVVGVVFVLAQLTGWQLATAWLASRLEYQPALGTPWTYFGPTPLYPPWAHFQWRERLVHLDSASRLLRSAQHASELSTIVAVAGTLWAAIDGVRRRRNRAEDLHGSSRFAGREVLEHANLLGHEGIVLAEWKENFWNRGRVLHHNGPEGVLLFAPPRTGKGVGPVLSTLLNWRHSVVAFDLRGDLYHGSSGWRSTGFRNHVYVLNFTANPSETAGNNPLDRVRIGTDHEFGDAMGIAVMLADPEGKQSQGANSHWADTSIALLTAAILHVLYRERSHGAVGTLSEVDQELSNPNRTHIQMLTEWLRYPHDPEGEREWRIDGVDTPTHPAVASAARDQLNREERERNAVLSSAVAKLVLFRDPVIAANTSHSSFAIKDIMDGDVPVTVYVVVEPAEKKRLRPLVQLFFDSVVRSLTAKADLSSGSSEKTHKHRLLLMLDEFTEIGRLSIFEESFAYCGGYGIVPFVVIQDYEQLRRVYGDRETISSCMDYWLVYAPNKFETAKMLSDKLGKTTVLVRSKRGARQGGDSEQQVSRDLMTPDEFMKLRRARKRKDRIVKAGEMVVFVHGHGLLAKQPLYFRNSALKGRYGRPAAPPCPEPWDRAAYEAARIDRHRRAAAERATRAEEAEQQSILEGAPDAPESEFAEEDQYA